MKPENHSINLPSVALIASNTNCSNDSTSRSIVPAKTTQQRNVRLAREIAKHMPRLLPIIALMSATSALAIPVESNSVYGKGMVLQTSNSTVLPAGVQFTGVEHSIESDRFLQIESVDRSKLTITTWETTLPVTLPSGKAATATFYGSPDKPLETPGTAVQRGFTLPEERITFSTDPEFLRNSGLNGIQHNNAFTGEGHGPTINPTEFGNAHIKGGMTTSANWMVVRDQDGKVLFEGTPATYGAQLYWDGNVAQISDAEGLNIGEGNYQTNREITTETTTETTQEQRSRQAIVETQHTVQGQKTWSTVEAQQRTELSTITKPFQTEETSRFRQTFGSDLRSIFPLHNVAILHHDKNTPSNFYLKTGFQLSGDVSNESNPTLSGQLRIPLDTRRGTSSLNILVGGAPQNDQPGQPDFYALLFAQLNTPLVRVVDGQYKPSRFVAGVRFGGGVFHVPIAEQVITRTISKSGLDILSERQTFNDFTTTTWGQDFTTNFTQQVANNYVDTYQVNTTIRTPVTRDITNLVVTRTDGSTFTAPGYQTVSEQRGDTVRTSAASLLGSTLVASTTTMQPGSTQFSEAQVLSQQTASQLVGAETTSQRVVQDVSVKQTVSEKDAWGHVMFINPYFGNFDLASIKKPGSLLYEIGGNFVRNSLLGNVSYKDSNLYLTTGVPLWNPTLSDTKTAGTGLLTMRAYAVYLPMTNDVRVGAGLQLSGF
ncbi:hypothetical protein OsccyDRAFT_1905 [Leptolyngbyaceae cyanobacterium JSC-12]|nr:hypothetical protein OsccyDRAFT_1905 [Leptolyngbyaceae cyanobacterium JSC-12]